ncbi:MAG: hypothetical protein ACOH2F_09800 [Cellulomonas sp.]
MTTPTRRARQHTPTSRSAITAMWAWDNAVSPRDDVAGRGYAPASPDRLAAFARAGELREVYVAAPSAGHGDAIADAFGETCRALRAAGVELSALGGEPAWLDDPSLVDRWFADALRSGSFDRVQVALEPWGAPRWSADPVGTLGAFLAVLDRARAAADPTAVDVAVPWWFAHEPFTDREPGTTMLDAVLARVDRVSILAFADRAAGPDGILALTARAVRAAVTADREFTIGVETCTPELAGGAQYTFFDEGPVALLRESAVVRARLMDVRGYRGVAVADHRSWRGLLGV